MSENASSPNPLQLLISLKKYITMIRDASGVQRENRLKKNIEEILISIEDRVFSIDLHTIQQTV